MARVLQVLLRPLPAWVRGRRVAAVVAIVWSVCVAAALPLTIDSLRTEDFDGLNFMLQLPFAMPWVLVLGPLYGPLPYETWAWIHAALGWCNAAILYVGISRRPTKQERHRAWLAELPPPG